MLLAQANPVPPVANLAAVIVIFTIVIGIGGATSAVLLRAGTFWVTGKEVDFGHAFNTIMISVFVTGLQKYLFGIAFYGRVPSAQEFSTSDLIGLPLTFLIQTLIFAARIELTFVKALLVHLVILGIVLAILVLATGAVVLFFVLT